jgi:hypothetical protein
MGNATSGDLKRVVVWSTGGIGSLSIVAANERPDLELVGVWVHSEDKVGTGHRLDLPRTGRGCRRPSPQLNAAMGASTMTSPKRVSCLDGGSRGAWPA